MNMFFLLEKSKSRICGRKNYLSKENLVLWWLAISKRYQVSKKLFCLSRWVVFQMFSLRLFLLLHLSLDLKWWENITVPWIHVYFLNQLVCDHLISRKILSVMRANCFFISLTSVSADISLCQARMHCAIFLVKFRWVNQNNFILLFTCVR